MALSSGYTPYSARNPFVENLVKRQAKQPRVFSPVVTEPWRNKPKQEKECCPGRDGDSEKEEKERNKSVSLAGSWPRTATTIDTLLASAVRSKKAIK
ncbi:hypothetical protein H105_04677 [Trichophyton soudanense CBS 452.61]|uniref:Uncharacterized protein n=1 Tax=Trichophyton soudanense CBS 452.61 TaxID=1215331 RepID=A0A022XRL7_TRISD|nr:hypothetical protein H105_04677 [Trichophyton soudanense CBS 452.61]